jgi:hypothetical protein
MLYALRLCTNEAPRAKARSFFSSCPSGEIPTASIRGLKAAVLKLRDKYNFMHKLAKSYAQMKLNFLGTLHRTETPPAQICAFAAYHRRT